MSKRARLSDIARKSRVSLTTVSLVLNGKPGIRPETRQRVLAAAQALGYTVTKPRNGGTAAPNEHDTSRASNLRTIALIIKTTPDLEAAANPFYSHVIAGIEEACRRRRINLLLATLPVDSNNVPLDMPAVLTEPDVDGLLLVGTILDRALQRVLQVQRVPVVLVDAYSDFSYDSAVTDNVNGACQAVSHLIARGHRHIGIVGSHPEAYPSIRERREGYLKALETHGIREHYFADSALGPDAARDATLRLLDAHPQVTALFGCNDEVAIAAMRAAQEFGKRVPQDLSVVGFDDIDLTPHVTPPLTTMRVDKLGMGRMAVHLLRNRLEHRDAEQITSLMHPRLIERQSVSTLTLHKVETTTP